MGYSLVDDLLSGMGLAIGWAVAMSIPLVGGPLATLLWGGQFPGATAFESRLFIAHVFIVPALIAALIGVHLLLISLLHHTQFAGRGTRERNVVGSPLWPSYAARSLGLFAVVVGGLLVLGASLQVNPIWLWGPYHPYLAENGAQPDWYLGWLIGALRMMPNWEPTLGGYTIVPNPFWGGVLFPTVVFGLLYAWPVLDRWVTHDHGEHHILQRPRDCPRRTAVGRRPVHVHGGAVLRRCDGPRVPGVRDPLPGGAGGDAGAVGCAAPRHGLGCAAGLRESRAR